VNRRSSRSDELVEQGDECGGVGRGAEHGGVETDFPPRDSEHGSGDRTWVEADRVLSEASPDGVVRRTRPCAEPVPLGRARQSVSQGWREREPRAESVARTKGGRMSEVVVVVVTEGLRGAEHAQRVSATDRWGASRRKIRMARRSVSQVVPPSSSAKRVDGLRFRS